MDITGTYTLQAPPEVVWNLLMDLHTLQRSIQGMERLERVGEDTYAFTLHIKHAPLRGTYSGNALVSKMDYPYTYHMKAEGEGAAGAFHSEWDITLTPLDENTVVAYKGSLLFSRANTQLSGSLVKGIVKVLIQQFFTSAADYLRSTGYAYQHDSGDQISQVEVAHIQNGRPESVTVQEEPSLLLFLVRQLGLGDQDPFLEEMWVKRLRRIGMLSMLLFLVWVGTRLPRPSRNKQGR